ncbi:MAG TPA: PfkB family carbohydrate kinase [Candidatus Polarisedimenticolia bacterium]|nr:PfkB family carbohydrate kinase [Candidatus Polarisedimenticolia bacterium]
MPVLVVGSVAFDSIETPFGARSEMLGGAATYFSLAASYFAPVQVIAAVGEDFPDRHRRLLESHGVDLGGLATLPGETFRWSGRYSFDLNARDTLETRLGVFESFAPRVPEGMRRPEFLFLGNIDPDLQRGVLEQVGRPRLVGCDTMNFWIEGKPEALRRTLAGVDLLVINDSEARELAREPNLVRAAAAIRAMGPRTLIVKRGEFGAAAFGATTPFAVPALLLDAVQDPTGAGDSFAGGLMGYLAAHAAGGAAITDGMMRRAIAMGSVMASFTVQSFGVDGLVGLSRERIDERFEQFRRLSHLGEA